MASAESDPDAIDLADVRYSWPSGGFALAIDRFSVERGERVLLVGPSGSGKSTMLGLIAGTIVADGGYVGVLGQEIATIGGPARDRFRAEHIGFIFQMFNLMPYLGVIDNVVLPLSFAPVRRRRTAGSPGGMREEARRLLEALGLTRETIDRSRSADLSVGQQQRVAAARALIGSPDIIIADEPTSALDRDRQERFLRLVFQEAERVGSTVLMVSHEKRFRAKFDRTVELASLGATPQIGAAS
jgi:putative ABC transport system ATP-binding protein